MTTSLNGKLEQVVEIVNYCSPNALGDLNVTLKDLSGTVPGTIHCKVLDVSSYEKDITVGASMILVNVSSVSALVDSLVVAIPFDDGPVQKTQGENSIMVNKATSSLNATKDAPTRSSMNNCKSTYHKDDINVIHLRNSFDKLIDVLIKL
ncbi:transposase, MuDR, MULE transposase domain protein [Tanacetum coccineum]|uniref:Transposase, MuDR, MULE transposase domain protein n=1 Tax=Tanacetum coccineum TaxID=301880 RepID=A0ABQ5FE54_9ASTR